MLWLVVWEEADNMVQVLPPTQTFGSRLSDAIGEAGETLGKAYFKKKSTEKDDRIMQDLENPALSPMQRISLAGGLSKEKFAALSPVLAAYTKAESQEKQRTANQDYINQILSGDGQDLSGQQPQNNLQMMPESPLMAALSATQGGAQVGNNGQGGQLPLAGVMNQGASQQTQPSPYQPPAPARINIPSENQILAAYAVDPKLAGILQNQRATALQQQGQERQLAHQQEDTQLKKEQFREKQSTSNKKQLLDVHRESSKYAEKLEESKKRAQSQKAATHTVRAALKKHKTGTFTWENFFKKQFKGTFLENIALTPEGAVVESSIPTFLEGGRELFGARLSDADLGVILGKTIDLGKSNETNEAILSFGEKTADLVLEKAKLADEVLKENKGYRPIDFQAQVERRFDEKYGRRIDDAFRESFGAKSTDIRMKDLQGNDLWVPPEDVQELVNSKLAVPA